MAPDVVDILRLRHAELTVESLTARACTRRRKAEALQMALWTHRDDVIGALVERQAMIEEIVQLRAGLRPFGRAALLVRPGDSSVLLSLAAPGSARRAFIQLRGSDFHRAAALANGRRP